MAYTGYLSDIYKPDTDEVLSSTIPIENYALFSIFRLG
ncbi:MAG: hypothetical protein ACJAW2_001249 [Shewanella sp.]|mgnify:FL=1|jgi:hypothetical protein